ncbi:MAG: ABC transporter permease [Bacilli bacterium]|nr:ABC transporter permease [Bacilli bacterium]
MENSTKKKKGNPLFSASLFKQSLKSNWVLWLIMTLGSAAIFVVINIVVGSRNLFTNIDMTKVSAYVKDEEMSWLQVLGLLETMGFKLERIQTMSQIDLNAILNDLVYKIAGVLLPMIYVMITANKLIAGQVSDGSMAYVLSTPTNRKKVIATQLNFLMLSVIAMYVVITAAALGSEALAGLIMKLQTGSQVQKLYFRSFLYCVASACSMIGLAGICFGASAFFNKSNQSIAVGGGVCVISFIACIMGLFGSKVFVSVGVGVAAMSSFNYASIFTLIDTESMGNFAKHFVYNMDAPASFAWIWKDVVLLAIGAVGASIGSIKFNHKDLPL